MKSQNICKINLQSSAQTLDVSNFVYESEAPSEVTNRIEQNHGMYLVVKGNGRFLTENTEVVLKTGLLFFTFAGVPFSVISMQQLHYLYITFQGGRARELFSRFGITPGNCVFQGFENLGPLWKDTLIRAEEKNIDLFSESMLLYAFSRLDDSFRSGCDLFNQILKIIEEQYTNYEFSLSLMAEQIGYNSKYLSHLFKEKSGVRFSEYLTNLRVKHAAFLMEQGVTAINNVALLSGYTDPLYFSKVFKKQIGISPREYTAALVQK